MKKFFVWTCFLLNVAILSAATIEIDGITWNYDIIENNEVWVSRFSAPKDIESVVVPSVIEGCPVTEIGGGFHLSLLDYDSLKTVTISANVRDIAITLDFNRSSALEKIIVDPANSVYWSFDGVLCYRFGDGGNAVVAIPAKKTGVLVVPKEITLIWWDKVNNDVSSLISRIDFEGRPPYDVGRTLREHFFSSSGVEIRYNALYADEWEKELMGVPNSKGYSPTATVDDGGPYVQAINGIEWSFIVSNGQAIVRSGDAWKPAIPQTTSGTVEVPEMLGGCPVMHIGDRAFYNCDQIVSVLLPSSIKTIGDEAFLNCYKLENVNLPEGLLRIGGYAFQTYGGNLSFPVLPDSLMFIGHSAFSGCTPTSPTLILPKSLVECGTDAFTDCGFEKMVFPPSLRKLGTIYSSSDHPLVCIFEGEVPEDEYSSGYPSPFYPEFRSYTVAMYSVWNASSWERAYGNYLGSGKMQSNIIKYVPQMSDVNGSTATSCHLTVTNVVVQYVLNSIQPQFALPASSDTGFVNVVTEIKSGGIVAIPSTWAENYPTFASKFGNDFTAALGKSTGKVGANGAPMLVWQDYVAGTDPTNPKDKFTASITIVDGKVRISYSPELDEERKALRKYTTWGKRSLLDTDWTEVQAGHESDYNFFKVSVEMR